MRRRGYRRERRCNLDKALSRKTGVYAGKVPHDLAILQKFFVCLISRPIYFIILFTHLISYFNPINVRSPAQAIRLEDSKGVRGATNTPRNIERAAGKQERVFLLERAGFGQLLKIP